jgi:hypothetical protein
MRNRLQPIPPTRIRFYRAGDQVDWPVGNNWIDRFRRMGLIHKDQESVALRDNISSPEIA